MPRKKIIYQPNLSYHVVSRCIELKPYLKSGSIKQLVEQVIVRTQKKYEFKFFGYVIMSNHIHLYIGTVEGGAPVYRVVQYFKARVAERFNQRYGRCGHFWNERYKCTITEHTRNQIQCCINVHHYICNNPVKACLVTRPGDYLFSSHRAYTDVRFSGYIRNIRIDLHPLISGLGCNAEERVARYLDLEKQYYSKTKNRLRL